MYLIVTLASKESVSQLEQFGNIIYQVKSIPAVILEIERNDYAEEIRYLPGVLNVTEQETGKLVGTSF